MVAPMTDPDPIQPIRFKIGKGGSLFRTIHDAVVKAFLNEGEEEEKALEEAQQHLAILENEVKGKKLFGGESIGFVDIAANFIAFCVGVIEEATQVKIMDLRTNSLTYANVLKNSSAKKLSRNPK